MKMSGYSSLGDVPFWRYTTSAIRDFKPIVCPFFERSIRMDLGLVAFLCLLGRS